MIFRTVGIAFATAVLSCTAAETIAQDDPEGPSSCVRLSRLDSNANCNESPTGRSIIIEQELEATTIRLPGVTLGTRRCQGKVSLSYLQRNTLVSIDAEIDNETCAASNGDLVLSIGTSNASGEVTNQRFTHPWAREDNQPVALNLEYPISENTESVRVRALRVGCTCAEAPQPDEEETLPE